MALLVSSKAKTKFFSAIREASSADRVFQRSFETSHSHSIRQTGVHLGGITPLPGQGRIQGAIGMISPPIQPANITLFTMFFYNSENSIRDIRPFCRPLFCHSIVVNYTSSFLLYHILLKSLP